ncbi:hypothetical protein ACBQ54_08235 [Providencia vermicola]|uniref:hypothetical protein n=1 Tax=Providencia vermicola TaxID=333965 RepID=UPI00352530D0
MEFKGLFVSIFLSGVMILPAHANSFSVKNGTVDEMPTETDFYNECVSTNTYTYLPMAGEPQSSVDKKRAKQQAGVKKKCKCAAPLEYKLFYELVGNDPEAFTKKMQSDQQLAMQTAQKVVDRKRQIDKQCTK